jgi:hypothetical protein
MRQFAGATLALLMCLTFGSHARAQEPPPRIGPFVVDLHATFPTFPNNVVQLANSRGLSLAELPGLGLGVDMGAHVYLLKWRAVTFGLGGEVTFGRAHSTPSTAAGQTLGLQPVRERFLSAAPQLSFNFGTGHGWSYLSGGIGRSVWSIHLDAEEPGEADLEPLKTINYGGGARWFAKPHLAFSFDIRFYAIDPGTPQFGFPGSPRTTLMIIGAGVSVK